MCIRGLYNHNPLLDASLRPSMYLGHGAGCAASWVSLRRRLRPRSRRSARRCQRSLSFRRHACYAVLRCKTPWSQRMLRDHSKLVGCSHRRASFRVVSDGEATHGSLVRDRWQGAAFRRRSATGSTGCTASWTAPSCGTSWPHSPLRCDRHSSGECRCGMPRPRAVMRRVLLGDL